ncbi:hypothetical protein [Lishizhenia sp.]|uniref:hypothetical protein n=1 Tax=Lishizhenia sp. TaxID=2497594 RepID=UPI00299D2A8D|nr:hypothetical protein [Lishizhenia sp.]MDX1445760.1 hypothetical protein [Lishizhenia sp.]
MKNLIAFSTVCLAGLFLGSCATSGSIADNDVYMQQPTASTLFEDETDPTSFANFKAQEREEIIVTQDHFTPFRGNFTVINNFGNMGSPFFPSPYYGHMHLVPYYYNGFYQGLTYGYGYSIYGNPYYNPYMWMNQHQVFIGPNFYYGYGQYSNGFGGYGGNVASHNPNHFYQHRTTPTVGAPRNSNYPSTLKNSPAVIHNTPRTPGRVDRNNNIAQQQTVRRNIGTSYQIGSGKPNRTVKNSGSSAVKPSGQQSYTGNAQSKQPTRTYRSPQSSSQERTTQPINGSSRRSAGSTSSGRSTTLGTPTNGNGVKITTPRSSTRPTPSTSSGGSSRSSSGTSGGSRRSSSGGSTSTSRRR